MRHSTERTDTLIQKYEKILKEDPSSGCFILLARLLIKKGNLKRAIEILNKGLLHDGENVTGRFMLAKLYYDLWMIEQAKKHFEKILKLSPDNLGAVRYLKEIYISEGKYDTASHIVKNLLNYFPHNDEIVRMLNDIEREKRRHGSSKHSTASEPSTVMIKKNPDDLFSTRTLADIYLRQCYYTESAKLYEKMFRKSLEDGGKEIGE